MARNGETETTIANVSYE